MASRAACGPFGVKNGRSSCLAIRSALTLLPPPSDRDCDLAIQRDPREGNRARSFAARSQIGRWRSGRWRSGGGARAAVSLTLAPRVIETVLPPTRRHWCRPLRSSRGRRPRPLPRCGRACPGATADLRGRLACAGSCACRRPKRLRVLPVGRHAGVPLRVLVPGASAARSMQVRGREDFAAHRLRSIVTHARPPAAVICCGLSPTVMVAIGLSLPGSIRRVVGFVVRRPHRSGRRPAGRV